MTGLTYKDNFTRVFDYTGDIETFVVPKNATMLYVWAIGAGGTGGNGFSRAAGSAGGGGGGGSCGGITMILIPTRFLPPTLYIQIGKGGSAGFDGYSWVMFRRPATLGTIVSDSIAMAIKGVDGGNGTATAAGAAGGTTSYINQYNMYSGLGVFQNQASIAGAIGGAQTGQGGGQINAFTNGIPFTGGAGGAGCTTTDYRGGYVVAPTNSGEHAGFTVLGGQTAGDNGSNGLQFDEPFICYGGAGGASNNSGVGGKGGNGAIGCGGGGGGAGVTGGSGGVGGNGRVIITWF
jgi:hypothetical protein